MDAVLLDLDGVIYQGESALPGACAALDWLAAERVPHLFLTNTTSRPVASIREKLQGMGIDVDQDQLLTPVNVARHWLQQQGKSRVAGLVVDATLEDLQGLDICRYPEQGEVDAVIVGDLAEQWSYERLNWAFRLLLENPAADLLALGMTRYCRSGDQLRLDVAPFVSALECATDRQPQVTGKPGDMMFATALGILNANPESAVMVGDDIRSDIGGAMEAGLRGVLVRTGKFRDEDLEGDIVPTAVLSSIDDFPDWYQAHQSKDSASS